MAKLRGQLLSPQPKKKKLKPIERSSPDFQPGDVGVLHLDERASVRSGVLHIWGDRGGTYADLCLLGLDYGQPTNIKTLALADTLGPHYTMLGHEPTTGLTLLCRGVGLPERDAQTLRAGLLCPSLATLAFGVIFRSLQATSSPVQKSCINNIRKINDIVKNQ